MIDKLKVLGAAVAFAVSLPFAASAATVVPLDVSDSGGSWDLLAADAYEIEDSFNGATGTTDLDYTFTVDAADAPQPGVAVAVNLIFNGVVEGLTMNWATADMAYDSATDMFVGAATVLASGPFTFTDLGAGATAATLVLNTLFEDPDTLSQTLNFGFDSFSGTSFSVSIDVAAVPVPAAGFLLIGALGALGVARRRKS